MDTDSFIIHIKTADFYILQILLMIFKNGLTHQTTVKMIKVRFQQVKTRKENAFFKDELGGKIKKEFVGHRVKTYACLMDDDSEKKEARGTKKFLIKKILKCNDCEHCFFNNKIILKQQQRCRSDYQ